MKKTIKNVLRKMAHESAAFSRIYRFASYLKTKKQARLSDEEFLKKKYLDEVGVPLNIENPKTFCEKLQWLKLYDHNPLYTQLADKYAVREYVKEKVGEKYLNELYGVYDSFEEIDFDKLPDKFVLKCNHDCGSVVLCKDKRTFDRESAKNFLEKALKRNYFWCAREWSYKNIKPRIVAEKFLEDDAVSLKGKDEIKTDGLIDYKFYCFSGQPKFLYVGFCNMKDGRKHDQLSYYDFDWNHTPFYRKDHEELPFEMEKPDNFEEMLSVATKLAEGIPFARVDLYRINNAILFSEITFYPGGGFGAFYPETWEETLGSWIALPEK